MKKSRSIKKTIYMAIVVVVVAAMVITCPDSQAHKEAVNKEFHKAVNAKMDQNNEDDESVGQALGRLLVGKLVDKGIDQAVEVNNYFVLSIGHLHYNSEDKVCSIGLLGHVFTTFDDEDVLEAMEN